MYGFRSNYTTPSGFCHPGVSGGAAQNLQLMGLQILKTADRFPVKEKRTKGTAQDMCGIP